jgi:TRAP-type C4-dicarboxylate transport system permease small subunit
MPAVVATIYKRLMRAVGFLNLTLAIIAAAVLFAVTMMIFAEVTLRYLGARSQLWVTEVSEYSLLYITFLAAPYLLQHRRHVTVDLLTSVSAAPTARMIELLVAVLGFALCLLLTIKGIHLVVDQYAMGLRRITVMAPRSWYIFAAFPAGMALLTIQFFDQIVTAITAKQQESA